LPTISTVGVRFGCACLRIGSAKAPVAIFYKYTP